MRLAPLIAAAALLAACGDDDEELAPRGVTASEARELNEAAAMLDENSVAADFAEDDDQDQP
jgi:hypothetical protein